MQQKRCGEPEASSRGRRLGAVRLDRALHGGHVPRHRRHGGGPVSAARSVRACTVRLACAVPLTIGHHALDQVWRRSCDALVLRGPDDRVSRERVRSDHLTEEPKIKVCRMACGSAVSRLADLRGWRVASRKHFAIWHDNISLNYI